MRILIIVVFFFFPGVIFAELSPTEKSIRDYILNQKQAQITFLESLVNINSGTTNPAGVHEVGEIMKRELEALGFQTHWREFPPSMHRAGTLIAERTGKQGKKLLLIGHLDTVFAKTNSLDKFVLQKKNSAKGPGVIDDKGGLVVMLFALKALHAAKALDNKSIIIVLTGDEEDSGKPTIISRKPLRDAATKSDVALDFEPTTLLNKVAIARRGIGDWVIKVRGNEAHSAGIFREEVGYGAIYELARLLNSMRTSLRSQNGLTFSPGLIVGGTLISLDKKGSEAKVFGKSNVVAKEALARGDYRFLTLKQKHWFEEKVTSLIKQHLPGTKSEVNFENGIPPMPPTAANKTLLKQLSEASEDLQLSKVVAFDPNLRGAGDISHVAAIVPANLAGLGPLGFASHSVDESIDLNSLPIQTQRAAIFMYRLLTTHTE